MTSGDRVRIFTIFPMLTPVAWSIRIEHMYEHLNEAIDVVEDFVSRFEPADVSGEEALALVGVFARLERIATAGRTLSGRRVEETRAWHGKGFRRFADWMASTAQTTLASAITTVERGRRLDTLPATRALFAAGELSAEQTRHISAAASANPAAERSLLDAAHMGSVEKLREECQQVIAAADHDKDEDQRRHRRRYLRIWPEDGMMRVDAKLTMDAGAKLREGIRARGEVYFRQARAAGSTERRECYAADALVAMADESTPGPKAVVNVIVDYAAIKRGSLESGERCLIPGIGPISIPAAQRLAEEGVIKALLSEDADVRAVVNFGRTVPPGVEAALRARDTSCVVPFCNERQKLEMHHYRELFVISRRTRLKDLCLVCHWHHLIITHRGWRIEGGPGEWVWLSPDEVERRSESAGYAKSRERIDADAARTDACSDSVAAARDP
jgi:hypothetical protein